MEKNEYKVAGYEIWEKAYYLFYVTALLIIIVCMLSQNTKPESGAPPPGPGDSDGGGPYFSNQNWIIENGDNVHRSNQTIILSGNLIIENGGNLTFRNVTLKMNCSKDGEFNIGVKNGSGFYIYDNDTKNTTTSDASVITAFNTAYEYMFYVSSGAKMEMKNSKLHECGYKEDKRGFTIESDDVIIDSNLISNNFYGIDVSDCKAKISNNIITNNQIDGILCRDNAEPIISNNTIRNNNGWGIKCKTSNSTILNNIISDNDDGIYCDCSPFIHNNKVLNNGGYGIYFYYTSVSIFNNIISNNWIGLCMKQKDVPEKDINVKAENCTILNNNKYDIEVLGSMSIPVKWTSIQLINTTFHYNENKIHGTWYASLKVSWYLNIKTIDKYNNIVHFANITIYNKSDKEMYNVTTNQDGWVKWLICTEYSYTWANVVYPYTNYTPHKINASKYGGKVNSTKITMNASKSITVQIVPNFLPVLDPGLDKSATEDQEVTFDASKSFDPDGYIISYSWDFDASDGIQADAIGIKTNYTYRKSGTYIVTLKVTDNCSATNMETMIVVVNNIPPIANLGDNQIVKEDEKVMFDGGNSTDTPSDIDRLLYTWYFGDGYIRTGINTTHTYSNNGTYNVILRVTDDDGATSEDTINVTVKNVAPIAEAGKNQTINEGKEITFDGSNSTDTPSDKLSLLYSWDFDLSDGIQEEAIGINPTHIYADNGVYTITLTVTDDNGVKDTDTMIVNVENLPPKLASIGNQIAVEDVPFKLTVTASDIKNDTLIFSDNTTLFDINSTTGLISFTPDNNDVGIYYVNISVKDDDGALDDETVIFIVQNTNDAPILEKIGNQYLTEDELFKLNVNATDVDKGDKLTFSDNTSLFDIDTTTGLISFTPTNDDVGKYWVNITVSDGNGGIYWEVVIFNINNTNDAPVISGVPNQFGYEDVSWTLNLTPYISDVDNSTDELSLSVDSDNVTVNGMILTFLYTNGENYEAITITVSDGLLSDNQTISVSVQNTNDAPELKAISRQNLTENVIFELDVNATDVDAGDVLIFLDNTTLFDIDQYTGLISFTPTNDDVGKYWVNITVSDGNGGIDWEVVIFNVNNINEAPVISGVPNQFGFEDENWTLNLTSYISDVDNSTDELTVYVDSNNVTVNGMILTFLYENGENYETVTITVSDGLLSAKQTISVSVQNTNDVPILENIGNQYLIEDRLFTLKVNASDVDKDDKLTFSDNIKLFDIDTTTGLISFIPTNDNVGKYLVNITVLDGNGGIDWEVVIFNINNTNDAPVIFGVPNQFGFEDESWTLNLTPYISDVDNSTDELIVYVDSDNITVNGTILTFLYENGENYETVTITVSDGLLSVNQTISVSVQNTNDAPILEKIGNQNLTEDVLFKLNVNASDVDKGDLLTFSDNTTLFDIDPASGMISFTPTNDDVGIYWANITVLDGNSGIDYEVVKFTINNTNDAPIISSVPNQFGFEDESWILNLSSYISDVDNDTDELTVSVDSDNVTVNGMILTFLYENGESYEIVTITVSDGLLSANQTISVYVQNTNDPPILEKIKDQILTEDIQFVLQIKATDIDNDTLRFFSDSKIFNIEPLTGVISFTPTNDDVGEHNITISVTDNKGGLDSIIVTFKVKNTNDPPVLSPIGTLIAIEGQSFRYTVSAIDIDVGDSLTFSSNSEFFDIDPKTGVISFAKDKKVKDGEYTVKITVRDSSGAKDQEKVNIIVLPKSSEEKDYTVPFVVLFILIVIVGIGNFLLRGKQRILKVKNQIKEEITKDKNLQNGNNLKNYNSSKLDKDEKN